jgi:hypothetical protein
MKICFTFVGQLERPPNRIEERDSCPREGETVAFGEEDAETELSVRTVVHYLDRSDFDVYVVLGPARP